MAMSRAHAAWIVALAVLVDTGCSHELSVRNLDAYAAPIRLSSFESPPNVAVLPFSGHPDALFYFNTLVERLNTSPVIGEFRTDYARGNSPTGFQPDLIFSISPQVNYRTSGWNFLINWPGFLIFTPAWNGYVYSADIMTQLVIHDGSGRVLSDAAIPITYSIRHAEMDRTIFTGLTWLEVSALALFGGIYNASVFDRDLIGQLQVQVKDNYGTYIANQLQPKIQAAADAVKPLPSVASPPPAAAPEPPAPGSGGEGPEQDPARVPEPTREESR